MSNWPAPCVLCGYNGPGFHQPDKHPCAEWATERDALLGELDRVNRVVDAVKRDLQKALQERNNARAAAKQYREAALVVCRALDNAREDVRSFLQDGTKS